ncbi:hypothetical protein P4U81_25760 [Bacillus paranthracis]|nr:hypothetical protein [Bacillus paranthracis]MED1684382.1 hypothetical protein [Bacillus paranthracis]
MATVLMFNFPGEGHVNPTLALIEELVKRGEEVVYYCVEEYKEKIEKTGALFRPYENFLAKVDMLKRMNGEIDPSELLLHMVKSMDKIIKIVIEELKEEKYDYVIYDNNFAVGWIIAEALHLHNAVMEVLSNDVYLENSHKIKCTLKNAGGYIKAAETIELFKLKTGIK